MALLAAFDAVAVTDRGEVAETERSERKDQAEQCAAGVEAPHDVPDIAAREDDKQNQAGARADEGRGDTDADAEEPAEPFFLTALDDRVMNEVALEDVVRGRRLQLDARIIGADGRHEAVAERVRRHADQYDFAAEGIGGNFALDNIRDRVTRNRAGGAAIMDHHPSGLIDRDFTVTHRNRGDSARS